MKREFVSHQTISIAGKRFVLVEEKEFRRLERQTGEKAAAPELPMLQEPEEEGYGAALVTIRTSFARYLIRERKALGLNQKQLVELAGTSNSTVCELEAGQLPLSVRTAVKVERALRREAKRQGLPEPEGGGYGPALKCLRASFIKDIIRERKALGLNQEQLAELADIATLTVYHLESGKHSATVRTAVKIERALRREAGRQAAE